MSAATAPSERYAQRLDWMKAIAGPGYGGKPEQDPDPESKFSWKKFFHTIYCYFKQKFTGEKCKREVKDHHGHR